MSRLATNVVNVVLYQLGWFACVLGGAWGHPVTGGCLALALAGVHLVLVRRPGNEVRLMLAACATGVVIDSLQQALGLFTFRSEPGWPLWIPLWVFVIWAQFATLLHFALRWLAGRYLLAALLGALGGPLAYWAGIRLGAASFGGAPWLSLAVLALVWAVVTPFLLRLSLLFPDPEGTYRRPHLAG